MRLHLEKNRTDCITGNADHPGGLDRGGLLHRQARPEKTARTGRTDGPYRSVEERDDR